MCHASPPPSPAPAGAPKAPSRSPGAACLAATLAAATANRSLGGLNQGSKAAGAPPGAAPPRAPYHGHTEQLPAPEARPPPACPPNCAAASATFNSAAACLTKLSNSCTSPAVPTVVEKNELHLARILALPSQGTAQAVPGLRDVRQRHNTGRGNQGLRLSHACAR